LQTIKIDLQVLICLRLVPLHLGHSVISFLPPFIKNIFKNLIEILICNKQ